MVSRTSLSKDLYPYTSILSGANPIYMSIGSPTAPLYRRREMVELLLSDLTTSYSLSDDGGTIECSLDSSPSSSTFISSNYSSSISVVSFLSVVTLLSFVTNLSKSLLTLPSESNFIAALLLLELN